jgi:acyl-CoA thioesterase
MSTPNILTDTTPVVRGTTPTSARSTITDAWGLFFAQGGVVMTAALRAMDAVLDRDDLSLASAGAVFCRPVACGPVDTEVDVLRSGRRGAQVQGSLRDSTAPEGAVSVAVQAVFTDPTMPGPQLAPLPRPVELGEPPAEDAERAFDNAFPLGFLDNTEWHVASGAGATMAANDVVPRQALWFRFSEPPAPEGADWNPALLPIPGDALGSALVTALGGGDTPVGSVSLQLDLQVHTPITGTWVGIDSWCTQIGNGLATGVVHLWSESGTHVATLNQTAMLRGLEG